MPAREEIRDAVQAADFLEAGICLARLGPAGREARVGPLARRLVAVIGETGSLPPPGVVADVAHLLCGGILELPKDAPAHDVELAKAIHLYEDRFLARLAEDSRLSAVQDAIAKVSEVKKDAAIAVFIARLFARIGYSGSASISPAFARRATASSARDLLGRGQALLASNEAVVARLTRGYASLVDAARRAQHMIGEADIFLLESFSKLSDLGRRVALEQALEAAEQLSLRLPKRMKPSTRAKRGVAPTQIQDEDKYPIGGFAAISTSGSLENMVTSELIYMDDVRSAEDIDLFDLRFVEGELLYFTRDESVFLRRHRELVFVFDEDLAHARVKDPGAPWQRMVMALGALACIARRAADWLREDDLMLRVVFAGPAKGASEAALAELLLAEWIEKGTAEVIETMESDAEFYFRLDVSLPKSFEDWAEHTRAVLQSIVDGA